MEQLQPLIKHRFWVLFLIAMLMIPMGWWLGTGSLATESTKRKSEIESFENAIPSGANLPNGKFKAGLAARNKIRKGYHELHSSDLFGDQRSRQTWPISIADSFKNIPYLGEIPAKKCSIYRDAYYRDSLERLYQIVSPVVVKTKNGQPTGDYSGKVLFDKNTIPIVPYKTWDHRLPTSPELWEAQENFWLLTALLEAVARVNKDADRIDTASIRMITNISLHGGTSASEGSEGEGSEGEGSENSPESGMGGGNPNYKPSGEEGPGGSETTTGNATGGVDSIGIDPTKTFGPEQPRANEAKGGEGESGMGPGASSGNPSYIPSGGGGEGGSEGGGLGANGLSKNSPYIDNNPEQPFKTRGFILGVLMKRTDIIRLQYELGRMSFPVEIRKVQYIDRETDLEGLSISSAGGTGGGFTPGEGGGAPMGAGKPYVPYPMGRVAPGPGASSTGPGPGVATPPSVTPGGPGATNPLGGQTTTSSTPYSSALTANGLAYVSIAGLMTIYQPPKPKENTDSTQGGTPSTNQQTPPSSNTNSKTVPMPQPGKVPATTGNKTSSQPLKSNPTTPKKNSPSVNPKSGIPNKKTSPAPPKKTG
jgi:hypothetical protein